MVDVSIPTVHDGVFFTAPDALPRGRHQLRRDEVLAAQRERLMIAVTELMAASGYRSLGVREISGRAQVSRAAFYQCFADKDECFYAAYERFIAVLVDRLVAALGAASDWEETLRGVVETYLSTLQSDLVVARAFQVEMDALGRPARQRRRDALVGLATLLKAERDRLFPGAEAVPDSAYVGSVYALRQLASDALDASPTPDLLALSAETSAWVARLLAPPIPTAAAPARSPHVPSTD